jgi:hypothetical protein
MVVVVVTVVQDMSRLGGELVEPVVVVQQTEHEELHGDILVMVQQVVQHLVEMAVRHIIMVRLLVEQEDVEVTYKQLVLVV